MIRTAPTAADAWISRVHGRLKETVENVTAFDDPLDVSKMTREERDRLKRQLIAQHPDAALVGVPRFVALRDVRSRPSSQSRLRRPR